MAKSVSFSQEKFKKGFKIAAQAVIATIGPKGKNVFLADPVLPRLTNDGASIANKIVLKDAEEDAGAWIVRAATARTADEVGDQTTTTAAIADALFDGVQTHSEPPVTIKNSLYAALPEITAAIKKASHETKVKDIEHIALVSAENATLAKHVSDIFKAKGADAQITVQDSGSSQWSIEMKDGYETKVGMMDWRLITNPKKATAEYKDIPVLCTHKKVDAITQLLPLYEKLGEKKLNKLVIVCDDMDIGALGTIVDNKLRGNISTLVIRATGDLLDDIAAVVGATAISQSTGADFHDDKILSYLGTAASVVSTAGTATVSGTTIFVGKKGIGAKQRADQLETQAKTLTNSLERTSMLKRAGKLRSGVAVLNLGAFSEQELGYLRDKADDAIKAVRSALEEGYVEGGGLCLYRIGNDMDGDTIGKKLLKAALQAPFRKIVENTGENFTDIVQGLKNQGYDAKEGKYADLIKAGIIDPAKGARVAVESAVSAIAEMIIVEALVVDYEDKA